MSLSVAKRPPGIFNLAVVVAALGYFVDIYDLLLFTIVKKESLLHVGSTDASMLADSSKVINWQMIGLLIGGIAWGILADKKGRLSVLFGSIILYSTANFFTAFIHTVDQYALCRFVAGDWQSNFQHRYLHRRPVGFYLCRSVRANLSGSDP